MRNLSKTQIRKLGDRLRKKDTSISVEDLDLLEEYRISFKNRISDVFNTLNEESKVIRHDSITTYRLKRIDTIIRKLYRLPSMELDRMWDIAGCRCVLNSEEKVRALRDKLRANFHVVKENDYYLNPTLSGYRSVHLYLTPNAQDKWPVEVQIRTKKDHNWATLVEIIDQIYDKSLKEGEEDPEFNEFLRLISELQSLEIDDKCSTINLVHKLQVFQKLYSVFIQNYLKVRADWLVMNKPKSHHFFVIEVEKNRPLISSYELFKDAEEFYFERFSSNQNLNIVLTFIPQSNFENLETAYSNYTLTTHSFIDDYFKLLSEVCGYLIRKKHFNHFFKVYKNVQNNLYSNLNIINKENTMIEEAIKVNKRKAKFWEKDFSKRINKRVNSFQTLAKEIEKSRPEGGFSLLIFNYYVWRINRRDSRISKQFLK